MFLEPGFPIWLNPIWWHDIVSEKGLGTHTCTADGLEKGHYAWQKAGLSFRMICKKGTLCQINSLFCIEVTQREEVVPYRIQSTENVRYRWFLCCNNFKESLSLLTYTTISTSKESRRLEEQDRSKSWTLLLQYKTERELCTINLFVWISLQQISLWPG